MITAEELVAFGRGEPDAVRAVYRVYGGMVFAVCLHALGSRDLAGEAAQQTFVNAWRRSASFDTGRELGPWLATIARHAAIDIHRREARRETVHLDEASAVESSVVAVAASAERSWEVAEVRAAIDALPGDEREVVRLQHLEELTHSEVAQRLGVAVGTVKSRSFRAHRHLAARLGHLREVAE